MFKKALIATVLALAATVAHSQAWIKITDSVGGFRLSADTTTLKVDAYQKQGAVGYRVSATMQYTGSKVLPPFVVIIDAEDCVERGGGVLVNVFSNNTTANYVWDMQGTMMYDAQGQFLCAWLLRRIELHQQGGARTAPAT